MSRKTSLPALRAFDAAARLGSFKAAATELSVSPTAVSHLIRNLEAQIGVALFTRQTRRVELTESGTSLARATSVAFQQIESALEDLIAAERTLTVTTTPAFASLWLAPRIADFERMHPNISVHVDTTTAAIDLSRDRHIDLAVRYGSGIYPGLEATNLIDERIAAFAAPEYLAQLRSLEDAQLLETKWQSTSLPAVTWNAWCDEAKVPYPDAKKIRRFDQEQHVLQAGLSGQGIILISTVLVADTLKRGWLQPFRPNVFVPGLFYSAVATAPLAATQKVRRFLDWMSDRTQELRGGIPA